MSPRPGYLALAIVLLAAAPVPAATDRPNILVILVDDLGARDLGIYGSTFHETPHLDRLARNGVLFRQAYAAANVCSPTRASLLTGRHPARLGITDWLPGRPDRPDQPLLRPALPGHLDPAEVTFAEVLRDAGYRTGFIGKWHLGEQSPHLPTAQGFDVNVGGSGKGQPPSYFSPHRLPNLEDGPDGEHLDDRLAREAAAFVRDAAARGQPFLLCLWHYAVHTPLQARPETIAKYERKLATFPPAGPAFTEDGPDGRVRVRQSHPTYAAMMESLDTSVGQTLAALESLGLLADTVVVFTSDNGGLSTAEGSPTSNLPLRAGKGWAYEGGVRTPLIVSWPARLPAGATTDTVVSSPDLFPTLLDLAGLPLRPDLHRDGRSFAAALRAPSDLTPERAIHWHYPHYSNQRGRPHGAIRVGRWKLIEWYEDNRTELYDLETDVGESTDRSGTEPAVAADLLRQLRAWREACGARMPTRRNP